MCGISGIVSFNKNIESQHIKDMTDIIYHRGPDDFGYLAFHSSKGDFQLFKENETTVEANVFFGHRRLSILDLSHLGHQPMSYCQDKYHIIFNGEIYNYIEIREVLLQKGYSFRSNSDTEVILAAYQEWGEECVHHFNGMWSFAILDTEKKSIFCSRDRLGIKPFYYSKKEDKFCFGSEIKQLLLLDWIDKEPDKGVLFDYLALGYYGGGNERTSFKNIKSLMGGHNLTIDLVKKDIVIKKYWDINLKYKNEGKTDKQYAEEFYKIFYDAVKIRMRSDVPLGTALSGGLDSSGIAVTVREILNKANSKQAQVTFTSVTDYEKYDERNYAQLIIDEVKSKAFFTSPDPEDLYNNIEKIVWHHDEPFPNTSIYSGWKIAELVKKSGVTVSLDGQGPDEMLGGYFPFATILAGDLKRLKIFKYVQNINEINSLYGTSKQKLVRKSIGNLFYQFIPIKNQPIIKRAKEILNEDFFNIGLKESIKLNDKQTFSSDPFTDYLYKATKFGSLPGILRQVDRNSMAFSIESRVPFLDYRLVEYIFSLPNDQKIRKGITKYVYRNSMKGKMNSEVRKRISKLGFVSGEQEWVKDKDIAKRIINQLKDSNSSYINKTYIDQLISNLQNGQFSSLIWKTINVSQWEKFFINDGK